jgi:predicted RNA methylase
VTDTAKTGASETKRYFTSLDTQTCLYDTQRVLYFEHAIQQTVRPGDIVVDAGSGTGVLGMLAVRAGAAKVYCIELNDEYVEVIRHNAIQNGMADKITALAGDATTIRLPEKVDVIISEVMSAGFFYEPQLQILQHLRQFLKPGGRVVPEGMDNFVELINAQQEFYGLTFNHDTRYHPCDDTTLTTRSKYLAVDFSRDTPLHIKARRTVRCTANGTANAIRIPYIIHFSEGVIGTNPTKFLLNPQIIFLAKPTQLQAGAYYDVTLDYKAAASPLACRIQVH